MKINFKLLLFVFIVSFPSVAFSGESLGKGTMTTKDVYCFDQEESTRLIERIKELETKEEMLELYKQIDVNNQEAIEAYKEAIAIREAEIAKYQEINSNDKKRIKQLEFRKKWSSVEKWIYFGVGASLAGGSIILIDSALD